MNRSIMAAAILSGASLLAGCASIVNGTNQVLSVETIYKGQQVTGATCQLVNPKGTFYVTSPGTVTISRAYDDLAIKCEKDGFQPGLASARSSTKGMAFGNILFGGPIGAAVDAGSGAAYDYPTLIRVVMGENTVINPPKPQGQPEQNSQPVATQVAPNQSAPVAQK